MFTVMVVGAGRIGASIAKLLHATGDYDVIVADRDSDALGRITAAAPLRTFRLEVEGGVEQLKQRLRALPGCPKVAVISACSFDVNRSIALAALEAGVSYFDLTEDVETTRHIRALAAEAAAGQIFMPQCGLAPGFIGILASSMVGGFDRLDAIKMRVGALPEYPHNHLMYHLTWSTEGVINEYCKPCETIHRGRRQEVPALDGLERFAIDGIEYEAFNTSGGTGTLCETLEGKVQALDYKTVRYTGHRDLVAFLLHGLRLADRRDLLKDVLERAVPVTFQDVVVVFCTVSGLRQGQLVQISDARKIYNQTIDGENWSAIQITTAAGVCAMIDLFAMGRLGPRGFLRQEQVGLDEFLANRFGRFYDTSLTPKLVWEYDGPAEAAQ
jgi:saccharopine dehydrogenase-like NADP-dependent oxidoreductase